MAPGVPSQTAMIPVAKNLRSTPVADTSSTEVVEFFLAELRARRTRLQDLMRLVNEKVNEQADLDGGAMRGTRAVSPASPHKCCMSTRRKCLHCPSVGGKRTLKAPIGTWRQP